MEGGDRNSRGPSPYGLLSAVYLKLLLALVICQIKKEGEWLVVVGRR
jgi:hypothetical protein